MTIAVGQSAIFANFNSSPRTTNTAVTTSATGSSFVVYVVVAGTLPTAAQISDTINGVASGNTYTQIGSNSTIAGESSAIFYCQNGAGGTNQLWSAAWTGGSQQIMVAAVEITGGALTGLLDQISSPMWNDDTASPFTANAITPAQAAELVLAFCYSSSNSGTEVPTFGSGFSTVVYAGDASTITGGIAGQVINSTSPVNISYTLAGAGSTESVTALVSFKAAGSSLALTAQTVTLSQGTFTPAASGTVTLTGQTITFTQGTASGSSFSKAFARAQPVPPLLASKALGPLGLSGFALGQHPQVTGATSASVTLTGQTITLSPGTLTPVTTDNVTLTGQSITFTQGTFTPAASGTVTLAGQTITFAQGTLTATSAGNVTMTGQSISFSQGTFTSTASGSATLTGQTINLTQGTMNVSGGSTVTLSGQTITSSQGAFSAQGTSNVSLTGQTITLSQGAFTVQSSGSATLSGQTVHFTQGTLVATGGTPVGGGSSPYGGFMANVGSLMVH